MKIKALVFLGRLGLLWQQPAAVPLIYLNLFLIIIQLAIILGLGHLLPPLIPFYYSRPWGSSQLASFHHLFLLPGLSFLDLILISFISSTLLDENILIRLLLWSSNIFAFLNILALAHLFFRLLI